MVEMNDNIRFLKNPTFDFSMYVDVKRAVGDTLKKLQILLRTLIGQKNL